MSKINHEAGLKFMELAQAIQEAIIEASAPHSRQSTDAGGMITRLSYDVDVVLSALSWAMASFIVQSGNYPTRRDRKRAVEEAARQILSFCPQVETVVAQATQPISSTPI